MGPYFVTSRSGVGSGRGGIGAWADYLIRRPSAVNSGLTLAVFKHSLAGDAALFRTADLDAYLAGGFDVRR